MLYFDRFRVCVCAVNSAGMSNVSEVAIVNTKSTVPVAPQQLTAKVSWQDFWFYCCKGSMGIITILFAPSTPK
jgi:hypothetical protein